MGDWISVNDRLPTSEETKDSIEGFIVCVKTDNKYSRFLKLLSECVEKDATVNYRVSRAYFDCNQKI